MYAQTARHPQLHAQTSLSLARHNSGSCESFLLTLNTVAFFVARNSSLLFHALEAASRVHAQGRAIEGYCHAT